jgi:hypothetical protein
LHRFFLVQDTKPEKSTKWPQNIPNGRKKTKLPWNIPTSCVGTYITRPSKIYSNWEFWFEKIPSGKTGFDDVISWGASSGACVILLATFRVKTLQQFWLLEKMYFIHVTFKIILSCFFSEKVSCKYVTFWGISEINLFAALDKFKNKYK